MAKKETITLSTDGAINSEFSGYTDKSCFNAAADISKQLEDLGILTQVNDVKIKDLSTQDTKNCAIQTQKIERK